MKPKEEIEKIGYVRDTEHKPELLYHAKKMGAIRLTLQALDTL
jgi:hypothetical protein